MRRLFAFALCVLVAGCGAKHYRVGDRRIRPLAVREGFWVVSPNGKAATTDVTVEDFARLAAVDAAIMGQGAGTRVSLRIQQGVDPADDLKGRGFLVDTGTYAGLKTQVSTTDPGRSVILPLAAPRNGFFSCVPDIKDASDCVLKMRRGDVTVTSSVKPKALRNWSAVVDAYGKVVDQALAN